MYRIAFNTLGCKVNQYETQAIKALFLKEGFIPVEFNEPADVYIINTCTVTSISDRKSRQMIRRAIKLNPKGIVVATGCYSQTSPEEVGNIEGIHLVVGTSQRNQMVELVLEKINGISGDKIQVKDIMKEKDFEPLVIEDCEERTRVFMKIQDGCDNYCSYCKIPYARGHARSRPLKDIYEEGMRLADAGFKEVVLTGIHLASYGKEIEGIDLIDAIKIIHDIKGIQRIRLGSLEPTNFTDEFISEVSGLSKVCPHFHISLQSGSDDTLKRMNRKYTTQMYREGVARLRAKIPDVAITTDLIVGFPAETQEEFLNTLKFCEEMGFSAMHVFKFSPREGTPAAKMKDQVDPIVKEDRSIKIINLANMMQQMFMEKMLGKVWEVLVDTETSDGIYEGHSRNYVKFEFAAPHDLKGQLVQIQAEVFSEEYIKGCII